VPQALDPETTSQEELGNESHNGKETGSRTHGEEKMSTEQKIIIIIYCKKQVTNVHA